MTDIKKLVSQNKIHFIYGCIILVLIIGLVLQYKFSQTVTTATPPVATITDISPAGVAEGQAAANKYTGAADAADVSNLIQKAQAKQPTAIYKTSTQVAADSKAQQLAKADKADYVLKETVVPKSGEVAAENSAVKNEEITNNYYAITQERKHRLAAGITVFRNEPYVSVMYTNDRLTFGLHSKDLKDIDGVTLAYTVKKW